MSFADDIEGIAAALRQYRVGDLPAMDAARVDRWLNQFNAASRPVMATELRHVFGHSFVSKRHVEHFLDQIVDHHAFTGGNPVAFWSSASVFDGQANGRSQHEMLAMLRPLVMAKTGVQIAQRSKAATLIYLDDILFSGSRVGNDLVPWIQNDAPAQATIKIVVYAYHESGRYFLDRKLKAVAEAAGKNITIRYGKVRELNARKSDRNTSDVLWPASVPLEGAAYQAQWCADFPVRTPDLHQGFFGSELGRATLEQELLKAGLKIRGFSANPSSILRPLGFSGFGFGFGSLLVTWRNCPNNAPLALWWGDPGAPLGHPFRNWFPLVPRATYGGDGF
jgi:hypothetical protein